MNVYYKLYCTKCKYCIDGCTVHKCKYAKRDGLQIYCNDCSEGVNYKTLCGDRKNCSFKNSFVPDEEDEKLLTQLDSALKCKIPFGKYKDKTIEDLLESNVSYLHWLLGIDTTRFLFESLCLCAFIICYKYYRLPKVSFGRSSSCEGGGDLHYWGEPLLEYNDLC